MVAIHGELSDPAGVTVCVDPLTACLHLAGWPDGAIIVRPAAQWPEAARYLAGEAVPSPIPAHRDAEPLVASVALRANVTRRTARRAVVRRIEREGGVGALFLPVAERWMRDKVTSDWVLPRDTPRRWLSNHVLFEALPMD